MHVKSGSGPKGLAELVKTVRSNGMLVEPAPPPQRERDLAEWVRGRAADAGVALRPDAAQLIAAHVGPDAGVISTLLGQLDAAHPGETIDRDQVGAVVSGPATAKAWDLTDAIDAGDKAKAIMRLHALLGDMHPLQVQSVLINHVRRLLAATELQPSSAGDVERALNVKGFPAKKLFEKVRSMPAGAAVAAHREVAGADVALRGGSGLDSAVVLEVLTVRLAVLVGARGRQRV
jgi:DNA polymerase III delta subunit